jgi:hypothetical protein
MVLTWEGLSGNPACLGKVLVKRDPASQTEFFVHHRIIETSVSLKDGQVQDNQGLNRDEKFTWIGFQVCRSLGLSKL